MPLLPSIHPCTLLLHLGTDHTLHPWPACHLYLLSAPSGGRLVFWMPSNPELYSPDELPSHPMLQLLHNSEQILTSRYSRRLITMVKVKPYDAAVAAAFKTERRDYVMALERLSEVVYYNKEATLAAAAAAAGGSSGGSNGGSSSEAGGEKQQQQQRQGWQQQNLMPSGMPRFRGKNL